MRYSYCDISRSKLASRIMLVLYYHYRWRSETSLSLKHKTWREWDIKLLNPVHFHEEQHVKKSYSTVAIDKRGHALNPVRDNSFTGDDTNTRVPW